MSGEQQTQPHTMFFDPFAPEGEQQILDPVASLEETFARYQEEKVSDETGALDQLVTRVETLFMDTHFMGRFNELQQAAAQLHAMCGEDHAAIQRLGANEYIATAVFGDNGAHAGHNHSQHAAGHEHDHRHHKDSGHEEDDEEDNHRKRRKKQAHRHTGSLVLGGRPRRLFAV